MLRIEDTSLQDDEETNYALIRAKSEMEELRLNPPANLQKFKMCASEMQRLKAIVENGRSSSASDKAIKAARVKVPAKINAESNPEAPAKSLKEAIVERINRDDYAPDFAMFEHMTENQRIDLDDEDGGENDIVRALKELTENGIL